VKGVLNYNLQDVKMGVASNQGLPPKAKRPDLACNEALPPTDTDLLFNTDPFTTFLEPNGWAIWDTPVEPPPF